MNSQELDVQLTEHCKNLGLKEHAFESLSQILSTENEEELLGDFKRSEIIPVFERFEYRLDTNKGYSIIATRFGLCVDDTKNVWIHGKEPIGYYILETDFEGEVLDDWFVITAEKYLKDIGISSHFQYINKLMPLNYLKRNHIQYEYVSYVSLVGTFFMSKQFEQVAIFIRRAFHWLENTDSSVLDKAYLKASTKFLKMLRNYLLENNLVTEERKKDLEKTRNVR